MTQQQIGFTLLMILVFGRVVCIGQKNGNGADLARPSAQQYRWHEQERIMFIHFGMATWQGREYDNFTTDLSKVNPAKANTDEWCRVAKSFGAKQIVFVAKHVGGFCWWPTKTTDYCVRNIAWKKGKGNLMGDIAASCRKFGLNLGVYIYPGDDKWGAGLGSGGRTSDPSKQDAYNKIYRQQLKELLTQYGDITEVWFDGTCVIDVRDILEAYAKNAVIFQSPQASIRWVGNEEGYAPYPAWNSLNSSDLKTGVATAVQGDPNGDAWAPLECDVPLYNHNWFWSKENEKKRRSLDELMKIYYRSAGRGALMLINATPDSTGVIPAEDVKRFAEFGKELEKRFADPVATVTNKKGKELIVSLDRPTLINHIITMEDYREGERIRAYDIEGLIGNEWKLLYSGSSVGRKKIDFFKDVTVSKIKLKIKNSVGEPLIRSLAAYNIQYQPDLFAEKETPLTQWKYLNTWMPEMFSNGDLSLNINLTSYIPVPGQYELAIQPSDKQKLTVIKGASLWYDGKRTLDQFVTIRDSSILINRTDQVTSESAIMLKIVIHTEDAAGNSGGILFRKTP